MSDIGLRSWSATLNPLSNPAPFHLLAYGFLFGSNIYQTFLNGIVAFRTLTRPQFALLQEAITPWFFALQTSLPLLMAVTWPAPRASLSQPTHIPDGWAGSLRTASSTRTAIVAMAVLGLVNWFGFGRMTTAAMVARKEQERKDGKKYWDKGPQSSEMQSLTLQFNVLHGISSAINMVHVGVSVWYAFVLGARL